MAKWAATTSNLPAYGERVISSVKWKAVISEIYDYIHTVRTASYGNVEPAAENGELWYDTNVGQNKLKVKTSTGWSGISSELPVASSTVLGGVKVGTNLSIDGEGVLSSTYTNYYPTTFSWTNGTTSGPTGSLTGTGMSAVSFGAIPTASASASGILTTGTQTIAGAKTFSSTITGDISGSSGSCTGNAATSTSTSQIAGVSVYASDTAPTGTTRVNVQGYFYATKVYNAVFNDYAECFDSDYHIDDIKYRVVEVRDNKVYPATEVSESVVGVASVSYGFLLYGSEEEVQLGVKVPVGMSGTLLVDAEDDVNVTHLNRFVCSGIEGKARVIPKGDVYKYEGCVVGKIIGVDEVNNQYKLVIVLK